MFHPDKLSFHKDNRQFCTYKKSRNIPQEYQAPFSFAETLDKVVQGRLFVAGMEMSEEV